eukprot:16429002-Heterocapsa_arctica.AAC.1
MSRVGPSVAGSIPPNAPEAHHYAGAGALRGRVPGPQGADARRVQSGPGRELGPRTLLRKVLYAFSGFSGFDAHANLLVNTMDTEFDPQLLDFAD